MLLSKIILGVVCCSSGVEARKAQLCNHNTCSVCKDVQNGNSLIVGIQSKSIKKEIENICNTILNQTTCCYKYYKTDIMGTRYN